MPCVPWCTRLLLSGEPQYNQVLLKLITSSHGLWLGSSIVDSMRWGGWTRLRTGIPAILRAQPQQFILRPHTGEGLTGKALTSSQFLGS